MVAEQDRQANARAHADMEFLAREVASLRMAVGEVATRDFLRSELRSLLQDLEEHVDERAQSHATEDESGPTHHLDLGIMSTPTLEQVNAALATVNDPEIKRPITDLGMVESVVIDDDGLVHVTVLLTVAGCPLKDTITRDVTGAVGKVAGVTGVDLTLGVMTAEQRSGLKETLSGGQAQREIPFAQPGSLTKVFAIASGKGGVGKSSVTVNLALAMAKQGLRVGIVDADIYGHSRPGDARRRRPPPDPGRRPDHAGPDAQRRLGDLDRDAEAAPRPGGRLARPDARPGPRADARGRLLGRPRRTPPRPPAGHRRRRDLARPAPAGCRGRRGDHAAGGRGRGRRAGRHDGLDDAPAGRRRRREHELPALPALRGAGTDHRLEIFGSGGGERVAATLSSRFGYDVPVLGQIPIDISLREGGDTGKPIVDSDPTAPGAVVLTEIATRLAGRGRGLAGMQLGLTPTSKF